MPGKVNPVIPEAVAMVGAQVVGNDATIAMGGQSGNFQLNVMLPVVVYNPVVGYELGAAVAKKAYAEGRAVKDIAREMTELTDEELDRLLDPAALTEGGIKH